MIICRHIIAQINRNQVISTCRSYSALNVNKTKEDRKYIQKANTVLGASFGLPTNCNRRCLSLEGFVAWQEKTYAGISNSYLVHTMQEGLLYIHDTTGLPWWATIIGSTVLLRGLMTLPLTIYQTYILAKVENISLELKDLVEELKKETAMAKHAYKLTDKQAVILYKKSLKKQWNNLITPIVASIYTSGRDEKYFSKANMFLPYRWDKSDERRKGLANHEPSAALPFAMGARSCIGKKIAMIQLSEIIKQVVNNFDIKCSPENLKVNAVTSMVLVPSKPIKLEFKLRN